MDLSEFVHEYDLDQLEQVTPVGQNFRMWITPRFRNHYILNHYEKFTSNIVKNLAHNIDVFIDVGAHYGYYSLLVSQTNPACQILAYEPSPQNYEILNRNIELNRCSNTRSFNQAVSNKKSITPFFISTASDNSAFISHPATPVKESIEVETVTLEEIINKSSDKRILIKIDTEGHELKVIEGIEKILSERDNIQLLIEFNPICMTLDGTTPEALLERISNLGYTSFFLDDKEHFYYQPSDGGVDSWREFMSESSYLNVLCKKKSTASNFLFFSHSSDLGGAERSLLELIKELTNEHNSMCTVILPAHGLLEEHLHQAGAATLIGSLNWWCALKTNPDISHAPDSYFQSYSWLVGNLENLLRINPDVVITNTMVIPWGALCAFQIKRPHVWMINEFGEKDHGFTFFLPFKQLLEVIETSSDHLITCSKAVQTELFPDTDPRKISTRYYYIETPVDSRVAPIPDGIFQVPDATRLLISGLLTENKGQEDAVRSVIELTKERQRKVELVIMGAADFAYRDYILNLIHTAAADEYIHLIPWQENVFSIINNADIVLVCSKMEAFGRVTLEAMLMGKAVITTNTGGSVELIENGLTGLLYSPGDYVQLADQIERLIDDQTLKATISQNAKNYARQNFTRERFGGHFFKLLKRLRNEDYQPKWHGSPFINFFFEVTRNHIETANRKIFEGDRELMELKTRLRQLEEEGNFLQGEVNFYKNSHSWKITKPLREIGKIIRHM